MVNPFLLTLVKIWKWLKRARFTSGKRAGKGSWKPPIITSQSGGNPIRGEGQGAAEPRSPSMPQLLAALLLPAHAPHCMLPPTDLQLNKQLNVLYTYFARRTSEIKSVLLALVEWGFFALLSISPLSSSPGSCKITFVKHRGIKQGALRGEKKSLQRNE